MRTTLDIDDPLIARLKRIKREESKSLGQVVSELLLFALTELKTRESKQDSEHDAPLMWVSQDMGAQIDVLDKDALYSILDD